MSASVRGTRPRDVVAPISLFWSGRKGGRDDLEDRSELSVVESDDDEASRVMTSRSSPLADDAREVADVEGHHDPILDRGELEEAFVLPAIEGPLLVGGAYLVATLPKASRDDTARDVSVEEEPHVAQSVEIRSIAGNSRRSSSSGRSLSRIASSTSSGCSSW